MQSREEKTKRKNLKLKKFLDIAYEKHNGFLWEAWSYGKIEVREEIREISNLFAPHERDRHRKKIAFDVAITYEKYEYLRSVGKFFEYFGNGQFRKALRGVDETFERQYFRNKEVFRMIIARLKKYRSSFGRIRALNKLCRKWGEVGRLSRLYRSSNRRAIVRLENHMVNALKKVNKKIFINDLESYVDLYLDFFLKEMERMNIWRGNLLEYMELSEAKEVTVEPIDVVEEPVSLEMPGMDLLVGAEQENLESAEGSSLETQ